MLILKLCKSTNQQTKIYTVEAEKGWRDGSPVKRACCSCRGHEFTCKHLHLLFTQTQNIYLHYKDVSLCLRCFQIALIRS